MDLSGNPQLSSPPPTVEDLATRIDVPLDGPDLTGDALATACRTARDLGLAAVTVRTHDLEAAARILAGSKVVLAASIDGPYGHATTAVKQYAARDALKRGAREIEATVSAAKLRAREFRYLEAELLQIAQACRESGAVLRVTYIPQYLTEELKMLVCRLARRAGAAFVNAPRQDHELLKAHARETVQLRRTDVSSLEEALEACAGGCARLEAQDPVGLLAQWKERLQPSPEARPS